jgi:hypothetical protein
MRVAWDSAEVGWAFQYGSVVRYPRASIEQLGSTASSLRSLPRGILDRRGHSSRSHNTRPNSSRWVDALFPGWEESCPSCTISHTSAPSVPGIPCMHSGRRLRRALLLSVRKPVFPLLQPSLSPRFVLLIVLPVSSRERGLEPVAKG